MTDAQLGLLPSVSRSVTPMLYPYYHSPTCSDYGAGDQTPAHYGMLWQALLEGDRDTGVYRYLTAVSGYQRQHGSPVSSAGVTEAVELTRSLACLKGYSVPSLCDLRDAAVTAMGHSSLPELVSAIADTEIGVAVGRLPQGVSRACLQDDFHRQLRELKLEKYKTETAFTLNLDLRERLNVKLEAAVYRELCQSSSLHRLRVLRVYFTVLRKEQQEAAIWAESWDIRWTPGVEIGLMESTLKGDTVAGAVSFAMEEQAVKAEQIGEATDVIEAACCCGIPEVVVYATDILQGLSVEAVGFMELTGIAQSVSAVVWFGNIRHLDSTLLLSVLNQMFFRACLVFLNSCIYDSQAEKGVIEVMDQLNSLCFHHDFLDEERFIHLLAETVSRDNLDTDISGFAAAILLERGRMEKEELSRQVRRRLSRGISAELGTEWFAGLSKKSRYVLIARLDLWRELGAHMDTLNDQEFKRALVFLRRAFVASSSREKLDVAENLDEIWQVNMARAGEILNGPLKGEGMELLDSLDGLDFDDTQDGWNMWSLKPE